MQENLSLGPLYRILKINEVLRMISISRSSHFEKLNRNSKNYDPTYPKPVKLGPRSVGYLEEEVVNWIEAKIEERK